MSRPPHSDAADGAARARSDRSARLKRAALWSAAVVAGTAVAMGIVIGVVVAMIYPRLPDVSEVAAYRPKLPLRVFTSDKVLVGEFGEERRTLMPIDEIPQV